MTVNEKANVIKDRDGVKIPQWYKTALEEYTEVSDLYPLPVGFTPASTDAQYPLPVSSDRVYCLDINSDASDINDFTGDICDLVNDYTVNNVAASVGAGGANPKSFTIALNGPIRTSTIGLGSPDTSLSNGKLTLIGIDGSEVRTPIDLSADSTKRGIMFFQFEETAFIKAKFEFYTDDEVTCGGIAIFKTQDVTISTITGLYPHDAQSVIPLPADTGGSDHIWESGIYDTKNYTWIIASCTSDVASATDGFVVEFSIDKVNWYWKSEFTVKAGKAKTFSDQPAARYMQIRYTNSTDGQTYFGMSTKLSPVPSKPSSHRLVDELDGQDDAELTMSQLLGLSELTLLHENIRTFRGALKVDTALVHREGVNELFHTLTGDDTTIAIASLVDDYIINVTDGSIWLVGDQLKIPNERYHFHITAIATNAITLDRRLDEAHAIGTVIQEINVDMNVDGTLASPQVFKIAPPANEIWQITRIITILTDGSAMDDGKFGSRVILPNGVVLRGNRDGHWRTGTIWKTNGDMALDQYDLTYTDKAPAGENGLRGRWTFTKAEFIVELDGSTGDYLAAYVQDALSSQSSFNLKAQGRVFGG